MTATIDPVAAWWEGGSGQPLYLRLRKLDSRGLQSAVESLPEYDGPTAVPPPDRAPPRAADLPEVQALRLDLQDRRTPFDTIECWIRALTMTTNSLAGKRPLEWTADDVAARCVALAGEAGGNYWSTLEAVREFWECLQPVALRLDEIPVGMPGLARGHWRLAHSSTSQP